MDPKEFYELLSAVHAATRADDEAQEQMLCLVEATLDPALNTPNRLGLWTVLRLWLSDHGYPLT